MEIKISTEEAIEIITEHFKNKGYQLETCIPVAFQEKQDGLYCFSVLVKFGINNQLSF